MGPYRQGDTALLNPHLPVIGRVYFYAEKAGEARATINSCARRRRKWL